MTIKNFEKIFDKAMASAKAHECIAYIESSNGNFSWNKGYGGKGLDTSIIMASVSKLFTTACILAMQDQAKISLEDKITKYFDNDILRGLHIYKGKDYSSELTISNLLFQTSGLPDVFGEGKNNLNKRSVHEDISVSFDDYIAIAKQLKPHFEPNTKNRAYYSDLNFEMLGKIIEKVTNETLKDSYQKFIFEPLGLKNTYLPTSEKEFIPHSFYKEKKIFRNNLILSIPACGGGVSTAREMMMFLKGFFGGKLFDKTILEKNQLYKPLQITMGGIHYGCGHMQIKLNGIVTGFKDKGSIIGHVGMSGTFAFYYPEKDLFLVGDVAQYADPGMCVRLAMRLALGAN